jgi:hypothetical protein
MSSANFSLDTINTSETVQKANTSNRRPLRPRAAVEIKIQIETLQERLDTFKRGLRTHEEHRVEVLAAIDRCAARMAARARTGLSPSHELSGYSVRSYAKSDEGEIVFRNGLKQDLEEELARTETSIKRLTAAVANTKAQTDVQLPKLEAELRESRAFEGL